MIRVAIADPHGIVRSGVGAVLAATADIRLVGEAGDSDNAVAVCTASRPDVLVTEIALPGSGVCEAIHRIRSVHRTVRILAFSALPEDLFAPRALRAGADGYLSKERPAAELPVAIRQVALGRRYLPRQGNSAIRRFPPSGEFTAHEALSNREYDVLVKIASGMRANDIGEVLGISPKTVRTYRARVLGKLKLQTTADLIVYAVSRELIALQAGTGAARPAAAS